MISIKVLHCSEVLRQRMAMDDELSDYERSNAALRQSIAQARDMAEESERLVRRAHPDWDEDEDLYRGE